MPIIDEDQILNRTQTGLTPEEAEITPVEPVEETGFLDAASAFFKMENPVYNVGKKAFGPSIDDTFDVNFDPLLKIQEERDDLIPYIDKFVEVKNEEQYQNKIKQIEFEQEQRDIFAKAPTLTKITSGLAASVVDPLILIPYAGVAKHANTVQRIARGAAVGVGAGAVAGSLREATLLGTQELRTKEEAMFNVVAESALGGILGAGVGALANPVKASSSRILSKALQGEDYKIKVDERGMPVLEKKDISAAETESEIDNLALENINENLARMASGPDALKAPDLRAILSPSEAVRKVGEVFYNSNYVRKKNVEGIATKPNAQNAIARRDNQTLEVMKQLDELYLKHTGVGQLKSGLSLTRPKNKISQDEFSRRIWNNLVDEDRIDDLDEVNKASKIMRAEMDKTVKELQAAKLLPDDLDPKFMRNYMTRVYDLDKLMNPQVQAKFVQKVQNWVRTHNKDGSVRVNVLDEDDAFKIADDMLMKIRGESDEQIALSAIAENFISKGKFLKERQLMIPDSEIAEFLSNDSTRLFKNYQDRTARLLETDKALKDAGYENFQDVIRGIRAEAEKAVRDLPDNPEGIKEAAKVGRKFKKEEDLANMMYRSLLGQLRKPGSADRWMDGLLNLQFTRLLGGVTISSLPEAFMAPFRFGFLNTLRDGYLPMIKSLKTAKLSKDQLNDLSGALEIEQSNVLRALGGIDDIENMGRNKTRAEMSLDLMSSTFAKASGITYWTSFHRRLASQISAADIMRTLEIGPQGDDIQRLASIGIGKNDYEKILNQINAHSQKTKGTFMMNPHLWRDKEALELMQNAIQTQVESVILKPGIESKPFFVQQSKVAQVLFQFKSFSSAATGKIAISALQRRDKSMLLGLTSLIAAGSMSGMIHDLIAGREIEDKPEDILLEGISRSGILGLAGNTILDTARVYSNDKTRRFGANHLESIFLGPSVGHVKEVIKSGEAIADGEMTDKEKKAATRLLPFMNLFYIKFLTERAFNEK